MAGNSFYSGSPSYGVPARIATFSAAEKQACKVSPRSDRNRACASRASPIVLVDMPDVAWCIASVSPVRVTVAGIFAWHRFPAFLGMRGI
jgi:hypothetical protein